MTLIPLIVTVILLALVILYITRPLFTSKPETKPLAPDEPSAFNQAAYQSILERIRQLDAEFKLGNFSAQDHAVQRAALVNEAALTLRELKSTDDTPYQD